MRMLLLEFFLEIEGKLIVQEVSDNGALNFFREQYSLFSSILVNVKWVVFVKSVKINF